MPSKKKAVQTPAVAYSRILEPQPPAELWEQMDEINARNRMNQTIEKKPAGSFTCNEYSARYNISNITGNKRLRRLVDLGEIEVVAKGMNNVYYYRAVRK